MKLHFDPNQQYQHDAINSIINIFEGQPLNQSNFGFSFQSESCLLNEVGVGNRLSISDEQILKNVKAVQKINEIAVSEKLDGLNFSVEMETGTGKTYVYLRTIYELSKKYGFKKFVIVVPSVAIREGVLKNLEITFDHFQNLYDKTPIGDYNPDWALIKKNKKTIYFVAETKSEGQELKISEKRKIKCSQAHFNEFKDVEYKQVTKVADLD